MCLSTYDGYFYHNVKKIISVTVHIINFLIVFLALNLTKGAQHLNIAAVIILSFLLNLAFYYKHNVFDPIYSFIKCFPSST